MRLTQRCKTLLLAFTMALWVVMPDATAYPTKPIRLIVPFPPGGPTDVFARLVGQQLGEKLGQPVVVENRAGAATMIGSSLVARAPADGHTLLFTASTLVISVQLQKDKPFDPLKDFMPVSPILAYPFYLVVNNALPVTNVQELIAYGKANPGKLSYGSRDVQESGRIRGRAHSLQRRSRVSAGRTDWSGALCVRQPRQCPTNGRGR
jgi:tripartite-type tricarboxylate transporter receptor subunit TctC